MPTNNVDNAKKFGEALARFAKVETPQRARLLHRRLHLEVLTRVVKRTPVDTGRARNNWQSSIGSPATGVVDAIDEKIKAGSAADVKDFSADSILSGKRRGRPSKDLGPIIASGEAALRDIKPFDVSFISNNLPYAEALENGHSKQAPEGMVSVTLAELAAGLNLAADEQLGGPAP